MSKKICNSSSYAVSRISMIFTHCRMVYMISRKLFVWNKNKKYAYHLYCIGFRLTEYFFFFFFFSFLATKKNSWIFYCNFGPILHIIITCVHRFEKHVFDKNAFKVLVLVFSVKKLFKLLTLNLPSLSHRRDLPLHKTFVQDPISSLFFWLFPLLRPRMIARRQLKSWCHPSLYTMRQHLVQLLYL